ncbi:MAG: hypothetical protein M5U08_15550 [Burkholderiales bacterium]|nr:hypothetical protein [Burkholderiales bacterium]
MSNSTAPAASTSTLKRQRASAKLTARSQPATEGSCVTLAVLMTGPAGEPTAPV